MSNIWYQMWFRLDYIWLCWEGEDLILLILGRDKLDLRL